MESLTKAQRIILEQIRNIDRSIDDFKRQKETMKAGLHELRNGEPIIQGPCFMTHPFTGKTVEVKPFTGPKPKKDKKPITNNIKKRIQS